METLAPDGTTPDQPDRTDSGRHLVPMLFVVLECDRPLAGGARYELRDVDRVVIGRGNERVGSVHERTLDLRLPSALLSGTHARLVREGDAWMLEDVGSRNGTYINRRRIERETLRDGDLFELGRVLVRFRIAGADQRVDIPDPCPSGFTTLLPELALELGELARIAASPLPVLLIGETGTGKELIARGIHELSRRPGPWVPVNCGALSASLLESQLFGHVRGSFTGALRDEPGFVRSSDGGTLFLDEIGDLPMPAQAALLRVLQEREVVPVGGTRAVKVDLRIVAATHRQLDLLAAREDFRADLYARLSGHTHYLRPLRERREDIGIVVADLLRKIVPDTALKLSVDAGRELVTGNWPHNIRQLEQSLARAVTLAEDGAIQQRHLAPPQRMTPPPQPAEQGPDDNARRDELRALLERYKGNVSEVARALHCSRMQVHRWMQRYGFDPATYRR